MSKTPLTDAIDDRFYEDGFPYREMRKHAHQLEEDRAILLLAVRAALEDDRIDVSSMTDEALVAKITEALGDNSNG
jgi:hypothetical protein